MSFMAHYHSTLLVLTCVTCLVNALSPVQATHPDPKPGASLWAGQIGERWELTPSPLAIPRVQSPQSSPKNQKATPAPNQPKPNLSSKLPQPLRTLAHYRGLLLLGGGAILVTGGAVLILLKLFSDEELEAARRGRPQLQPLNAVNPQAKLGTSAEGVSPATEHPFYPSLSGTLPGADGKGMPRVYTIHTSILDPASEESEEAPSLDAETDPSAKYPESYSNGSADEASVSGPSRLGEATVESWGEKTSGLPRNIIEELIRDLHHPNPTQRRQAIWELGHRGDSRAIEPLVNLLVGSDSKQHSLILATLSEIGIRILKPMNRVWVISLQDSKAEVRKNAIRDLTRLYELLAQVSPLLQRAADDPDPEVQETARWALTQLKAIGRGEESDRGVK